MELELYFVRLAKDISKPELKVQRRLLIGLSVIFAITGGIASGNWWVDLLYPKTETSSSITVAELSTTTSITSTTTTIVTTTTTVDSPPLAEGRFCLMFLDTVDQRIWEQSGGTDKQLADIIEDKPCIEWSFVTEEAGRTYNNWNLREIFYWETFVFEDGDIGIMFDMGNFPTSILRDTWDDIDIEVVEDILSQL